MTHKDINARIRCMQVVYPHGEDELPWIVLATSDGAFQIWDFASFALDAEAPEEANKAVEPIASTVLLTKPRVTCLSVCIATEKIASATADKEQSHKAKKVKKPAKPAAPTNAPRVVVEFDEAEAKSDASKKRKPDSKPQKAKKKKAKQ